MKIRESITYNTTTTIAHLQPYDMFTLNTWSIMLVVPKKIYMYITTMYHGPKYLELIDGCWKDTRAAFHISEPISIIKVETLEYKKV